MTLITNFREFSFTSFSVHGSFWSADGEFWARKGIGRVKLEPAANFSVEILLTSLCASDDNSYYRQIQATEFGEALRSSTADFVLGTCSRVIFHLYSISRPLKPCSNSRDKISLSRRKL